MPNYKNSDYFRLNQSETFDQTYSPGELAPTSGVYRCDACGYEAVSTKGHPLPPANDCRNHSAAWRCSFGQVRWRLV